MVGLHVIVIPSWYPSSSSPEAGAFVSEQVRALAREGLRITLSLWGQGETELSLRRPGLLWRRLGQQMRSGASARWQEDGVDHLLTRRLTWSPRVPWDELSGAIDATRRNSMEASANLGGVDLIHAHVSYPAGYIASVVAKEMGIPYVLTEHMGPFPLPGLLRQGRPISAVDTAILGAEATIAVGERLADEIASFGFARPLVVPNLVNESRFTLRTSLSGRRPFRFLTVGRLVPAKGLDLLLRALAAVGGSTHESELVVVGEGPSASHLRALAVRLGVSHRVTWTGAIGPSQVPAVMASCDAFVLPSRHESFGVVLAEATASGLPVVATRCGGPEEIVNEINGLLVDVDDVDGLAQAMRSIQHEHAQYHASDIRADCVSRFGRDAVVRRICEVYERVLA